MLNLIVIPNRSKPISENSYYVTGYVAGQFSVLRKNKAIKVVTSIPSGTIQRKLWVEGFKSFMMKAGLRPIPRGCTNPLTKLQLRRYRRHDQ